MMKIAVLVSGGGTNLQAILESERRGENPNGKVTLVVASKPGVYALERAASFGVSTAVVSRKDYASSEEFDAALLSVLQENGIELVVLAGFLSVLGPSTRMLCKWSENDMAVGIPYELFEQIVEGVEATQPNY